MACLYDRISRSFCFNAGSGAFETGDTVTPETADSDALVWSDVASLASAVSAIWDAGGGNDTSFATAANWADDTVPDLANGSAAVSLRRTAPKRGLGKTHSYAASASMQQMISNCPQQGSQTFRWLRRHLAQEQRHGNTFILALLYARHADGSGHRSDVPSTNVWRRLQLIDDLSGASNRTLTVTGSGTLGFYATNSFAGSIHIKSGVMKLFSQERLFGSANSGGVVIVDQTTGAEWNQFGAVVDKPIFVTAADVSAGRFYTGASYGTNWFTAPITVGDNTFNWAIYGDTVIAGGATFGTRVRFTEGASLSIRDTPIFAKEIEMWDAKELHLEVPSNRIWSIGFSYWQTKPGNQIHCWAASVFAHYDTSLVLDKSTTFHLHGTTKIFPTCD